MTKMDSLPKTNSSPILSSGICWVLSAFWVCTASHTFEPSLHDKVLLVTASAAFSANIFPAQRHLRPLPRALTAELHVYLMGQQPWFTSLSGNCWENRHSISPSDWYLLWYSWKPSALRFMFRVEWLFCSKSAKEKTIRHHKKGMVPPVWNVKQVSFNNKLNSIVYTVIWIVKLLRCGFLSGFLLPSFTSPWSCSWYRSSRSINTWNGETKHVSL